jgi:hypothetical protein
MCSDVISSTKLFGASLSSILAVTLITVELLVIITLSCHSSNNRPKSRAVLRSVSLDYTMHHARDSEVTFMESVKRRKQLGGIAGFRNRLFKLQDKHSQSERQTDTERGKRPMKKHRILLRNPEDKLLAVSEQCL